MASSSLSAEARSIDSAKLYDAFISHRGPDVKHTLAKQLYDLLQKRGCKPFLDREEIEGGDSITSAIRNAICSSHVQIAIFSKGFAESSWCLDEVFLMLQQTDAIFIPLFYGVKPSELRYINDNSKSQYAKAFDNYKRKGRNLDKLARWKMALGSAADKSGYELGEHQVDVWEEIVSRVVQVLQDRTPLPVAKYPVGLDDLVQDFERCYSKRTGMVGIFGLGGSGKTTLAKELFNKKRSGYHKSCFLFDVRESHARRKLKSLQRQLLKDLFSRDEKIIDVERGLGILEDHLRRASKLNFLIVLDDIDHQEQLHALLLQDMLGCGSLVIITTRDQSMLRDVVARFEMKRMDRNHAMDLFCSHAFHTRNPPTDYQELVERFVEFCRDLPLCLVVLGAHVYKMDANNWKLELKRVEETQHKDIKKILKISFDGLDRHEKEIFIDIACIFNMKHRYKAIKIWKACGWKAEHALRTLQDKCLIQINSWLNEFEMHDHLRDLGRDMADELGTPRLCQPELLRFMEAKGFRQTLEGTSKGRCFHSFWDSSLRRKITYFIVDTDLVFFESIEDGGSQLYIPSWLPLQKLRHLDICGVKDLWRSFEEQLEPHAQAIFQLRTLKISASPSLQKLPNIIEKFIHLGKLEIERSLEKTDITSFVQSLKQLSNLKSLSLATEGGLFEGNLDLSKGRESSTSSCMDKLETIQLWRLTNILKVVISEEMCPKLETLEIGWMGNLKEIELKQPKRLSTLRVHDCQKLETISGLQVLNENKCAGLKVRDRSSLEDIRITGCPKLQRVQGVEELPGLKNLAIWRK